MRRWTALAGAARGRITLIVGNGPSRRGMNALVHLAAQDGAFIVGCNAYWREPLPTPDLLVCYDALQADATLRATRDFQVLVPEQRSPEVAVDPSLASDPRLLEAAPHRATGKADDAIDPGWSPAVVALGNLSGLLAYQAALIAGASAIYLLGVDCAGIVLSGSGGVREVLLSAVDERTQGYGPARVPRDATIGPDDAARPIAWDQYRSTWRALTRHAEQRGVETYRAVAAGALDWLEVKPPCRV